MPPGRVQSQRRGAKNAVFRPKTGGKTGLFPQNRLNPTTTELYGQDQSGEVRRGVERPGVQEEEIRRLTQINAD
jgi:hypothetical protein